MRLTEIITPDSSLCKLSGVSKKRTLETIANILADQNEGLNNEDIFMRLIQRERLGSTGIGNGIAIPHCRIPQCDHVIGALVSLESPIEFESIDDQPVDLIFVLLVPEESFSEHLETLATLAGLFNQDAFCKGLRQAQTQQDLFLFATDFAGA